MSSKKWSTVLERKRIHMTCDAIRLVEDDVVRTMSMNSSDDDESFLYSYNGSDKKTTMMTTCHYHHYRHPHHRLPRLLLLHLHPHGVQYRTTLCLMND